MNKEKETRYRECQVLCYDNKMKTRDSCVITFYHFRVFLFVFLGDIKLGNKCDFEFQIIK